MYGRQCNAYPLSMRELFSLTVLSHKIPITQTTSTQRTHLSIYSICASTVHQALEDKVVHYGAFNTRLTRSYNTVIKMFSYRLFDCRINS